VYHLKGMLYHPQVNGTVEHFNKILEYALAKVCNTQRNDWDMCIPIVLWAYRMTYNNLIGEMPF